MVERIIKVDTAIELDSTPERCLVAIECARATGRGLERIAVGKLEKVELE
jgi:hypothetical protein